jgi:hypothetical protein
MNEYPPILSGDALTQIAALRDYLVRQRRNRDEETQEAASEAAAIVKGNSSSVRAAAPQGEGKDGSGTASGTMSQAAQLRALIVKTAKDSRERDSVISTSVGELSHEMRQNYVAQSEFGSYQQEVQLLIEATARQIVESYGYSEAIQAARAEMGQMGETIAGYMTEINGEIRRGFLEDPDTHETVLGIAIAQKLEFTGRELTDAGWAYYELSPGQTLGLYTATGWQFWVNGRKVGWFSSADGMLHTVQQQVEEEIRIGDWSMTASGGFGIKYVG